MSKVLRVRLSTDEYEMIEKLAKLDNKSLSQFARVKLKESIQSEMRETSLLEKLIRMIENLSLFQSQMQIKTATASDDELQREMYKILLALYRHARIVAEMTIAMHSERQKYLQLRAEIENELNIEI